MKNKNDKNLYYQNKYRIPVTRLKNWDYASSSWYFITVCTKNREYLFGEIIDGEMYYSELGHVVATSWLATQRIYDVLISDAWVIMPNHVHLLFYINSSPDKPYEINQFGKMIKNSVSSIINHFKGRVTKYAKRENIPFEWQSRFDDRIVRKQKSFNTIQNYIITNPQKWNNDKFINANQK